MKTSNKKLISDNKSLQETVRKQQLALVKTEENYKVAQSQLKEKDLEIQTLEFKAEQLELQLRKALQQRYGRKADQVPSNQLSFFDEAKIDVPEEELEKANEEITIPEHQRKKKGRKSLPKKFPRKEISHDLPEEEKICECGAALTHISDVESEQLEYIPAQVNVLVNKRKKYACKDCEETIKLAPLPKMPIPKSIATPSLLASILTSKFCDHLPLYRQEHIWQRYGVDLPRQTMCNWVIKCAELLAKTVDAMKHNIVTSNYARADETTVQVLKEEGREPSAKSYMWIFMTGSKTNNNIVFEYHPTRGGDAANNFFQGFKGYLQTDGYYGYNTLRKSKDIKSAGCMAHCRREFTDITKIVKKVGKAHEALKYINLLYKIETKIKNYSIDDKYKYRQEHSKPIVEKFKIWLDKSVNQVPPKLPIGKAINYTLNNWEYLITYLENGMLDIDNNWCENQLRPFTLGRKNWLFAGNSKGAWAASIIYSLVITAKANGLEPFYYLMDILAKAPYCETSQDFAKLIPSADYFK